MSTTDTNPVATGEDSAKLSTDALLDALKDTEKTDAEKVSQGFASTSFSGHVGPSSLVVPSGIDRIIAQETAKQNTDAVSRENETVKHALREHYSDVQKGQFESGYGKRSKSQNKRKGKAKAKGTAYQDRMSLKATRGRKGRQSRHSMY